MKLNPKKFVAFLEAFGVTLADDDNVVLSGQKFCLHSARLLVFHRMCTTNDRWMTFIKKFEQDKNNIRLSQFKKIHLAEFDLEVASYSRKWYRDFCPSDNELNRYKGNTEDVTPMGGEIVSMGNGVYAIINTGIHCLDGDTVMTKVEEGDETAAHWLEMCTYVCNHRRRRG
jgi:hypothetical protein